MREFRVIGPPGTGKTTWLSRNIEHAAEKYGGQSVMVCSLTRAAAAEVASRGTHVPKDNIGTLHSLAYRAVGARDIAETKVKGWNEYVGLEGEQWARLSMERSADAEDIVELFIPGETAGDCACREMGVLRSRMIDREQWPERVKDFAKLWDRWKADVGLMDFTDLIEIALRDVDVAPGDPASLFIDESQDFSRLAWALARKWGEKALSFIAVGDPDQLLYGWAGVDTDAFTAVSLPVEQQRVLHQSYRVPVAVHEYAVRWIERTPGRQRVDYKPRDFTGDVRRANASWKYPEPAVNDAERQLAEGKSVLFCTTCSYMLTPLLAVLRHRGIPFHNPYRVKRGDWNPLRRSGKGTSAAQRVLAFAHPSGRIGTGNTPQPWWTAGDVHAFADWLDSKQAMHRGAKKQIAEWAEDDPKRLVSGEELESVLLDAGVNSLIDGDLNWLSSHVLDTHRRKLDYPVKIIGKYGAPGLTKEPKVIVSTIHGCKGGEADVCYIFPDLSPPAMQEWARPDGYSEREGIRRTFYVGFTRAREELVLCQPSSPMAVNFN